MVWYLHLAPPLGLTGSNLSEIFDNKKTGVPGLLCEIVSMILRLAFVVEHRLATDGQTEKQRDGHRAI